MLASLEPDIDRLSALYRYGILDADPDPFLEAVANKLAPAFGDMAVQIVMIDDHRLWYAASAGPGLEERGRHGTLAAAVIDEPEPLVVGDTVEDSRFSSSPSVVNTPHLRSFVAVALRTPDNDVLGAIAAADTGARAFRPEHVELLERGGARVMERLEARRRLTLDPQTGAMSQATFRNQITRLSAVATRHRRELSLLAVDIRALRALLQGFHVDLGRLVLDRIAGLGRQNVRRLDSFGRLDESRFAVLLPNTDETGARSLGRRILEGLASGWDMPDSGEPASIPAGVGVATFRPGLDGTDDLVARALRDCRRSWFGNPPNSLTPQVA